MRNILVLLAIAVVYCNANRAKRLSALRVSSISGNDVFNIAKIGQSKGCVVTGNKLYVNGIYSRELTPAEIDEAQAYQVEAIEYKKLLQAAMLKQAESLEDISSFFTGNIAKVKFPDTPKKPSFCSEEVTKQFNLDGCMIQSNKVYIGTEYARDLTSDEVEQLNEYEKELRVYEKAVAEQVKERLKAFNFTTSRILGQLNAPPSSPTPLRRSSPAVTSETLTAPVPPNFCVTVY